MLLVRNSRGVPATIALMFQWQPYQSSTSATFDHRLPLWF